MLFQDRYDAGIQLAKKLAGYRRENVLVLALPRGGIEVAYPISVALRAPLDVWCVRKIGAPGHEEYGLGAVAEGGVVHLDPDSLRLLGLDETALRPAIERKRREVEMRMRMYRNGGETPAIAGRTIVLVDDGIATGGTVEAAIRSLRARKPARIVLAVPVAAASSLRRLQPLCDDAVVLHAPEDLHAVGEWYDDFRQVQDERVIDLLESRRESLEIARRSTR